MTTQLDYDAQESMNEGRGLCRVLAVGVLLVAATVAGCVFTGCARRAAMSRYRLLTGSLCLLAGLCFGGVVLTPDLSAYATTGAVAAVQAEVDVVSNLVETTRGTYVDIATNVVYHVVVSNGHWLIREVE